MRTHGHATLLTTSLMVAALGVFHIARPVAVSAQASASLTVSATVVRSDAAWSGHEMGQALVRSVVSSDSEGIDGADIIDASIERDGTMAWVEPIPTSASEPTVTVAHVGS